MQSHSDVSGGLIDARGDDIGGSVPCDRCLQVVVARHSFAVTSCVVVGVTPLHEAEATHHEYRPDLARVAVRLLIEAAQDQGDEPSDGRLVLQFARSGDRVDAVCREFIGGSVGSDASLLDGFGNEVLQECVQMLMRVSNVFAAVQKFREFGTVCLA